MFSLTSNTTRSAVSEVGDTGYKLEEINATVIARKHILRRRIRKALEFLCHFRPRTGMFWQMTWSTQAHVTNRFPPYSLEKDAVRASKDFDDDNINSASVSCL